MYFSFHVLTMPFSFRLFSAVYNMNSVNSKVLAFFSDANHHGSNCWLVTKGIFVEAKLIPTKCKEIKIAT